MLHTQTLASLLKQYFYAQRVLPVPGLGTFRAGTGEKAEQDGAEMPVELSFTQDARTEADDALIRYIMEKTGKMRSLALADLQSFAGQAREMLNIRQPFDFEGIGTLYMDPRGLIHLREAPRTRETAAAPSSAHPLSRVKAHPAGKKRTGRNLLLALSFLFVVLALLAGFYFFRMQGIRKGPLPAPAAPQESALVKPQQPPATDSAAAATGLLQYEVVFETAGKSRALHRYEELKSWGHHIRLTTHDSVRYTLSVPFRTAPEDSSAMKDSIFIQYGRPVYIRLP
ncbi:hypothetical protein [Compostibacter hankyongensis]|uniref:CCDC81-like prokaryotic HU domain-containing protein n=1 Tax=Compostibacter hankyongensis TaxID=1007089 RepID=A0ABP8FP02_9BACT